MSLPGTLVNWLPMQFCDNSGTPLAGGFVEFFIAGSGTRKNTYNNADLDISHVNANPVVLDSSGRPSTAIFLTTGGYDATIKDANSVLIKSVSGFEDVATTFLGSLGVNTTGGARNVTDGYTIVATDYFITCNGTGGPDPMTVHLPAVVGWKNTIGIKNIGSVGVKVVPHAGDTIELSLTQWVINTAASPTFFTTTFGPDGVSSFLIVSSHGF